MLKKQQAISAIALGMLVSGCAVLRPQQEMLKAPVEEKVNSAASDRAFILREGVSLQHAAKLLGALDGKVYITDGEDLKLPGASMPIRSSSDFVDYLKAYDFAVEMSGDEAKSKYVKMRIRQKEPQSRVRATTCRTKLAGTIPLGPVVTEICETAGLECNYVDSGAAAYAGALYSAAFSGTCAGALDYLARRADLDITYLADSVEFRMMDTATIDLGIPLRDRRVALDILADGRPAQTGSTGSATTTTGSVGAGANASSNTASGSKSLQSGYATNYFQSIRAVLESSKTPWGTWHYIPETGQVYVRDKADAVAAVRSSLNRVAQTFQSRFDVTLTLYRLTENKGREIGSNLSHIVNNNLSLALGGQAYLLDKAAGILDYATNRRSAVVNLLSEWGSVETLDTYTLTVQSGIPQTLKVANNTEYIRNISTSVTGTTGTVSSSIEQANATDGAFVTVQARQAGTGKISVDLGVFINRLDGFDTTQTQSSVVKSQRGFERTFDTMALIDEGVPYIAAVVSQKTSNSTTASVPGVEGSYLAGLMGNVASKRTRTYIVMMVEAGVSGR